MEVYNIRYHCKNRNMEVSMGYCEKCYSANFHDGANSWYTCISRNLSSEEMADTGTLINKLRLQQVSA